MTIKTQTSAFQISETLAQLLTDTLTALGGYPHRSITVNFRDPSYSAEKGGYRQVEIRIDDHGEIAYITEFSYFGSGDFSELGKATDFDFSMGHYSNEYRSYPINDEAVEEFYRIWEQNFCAYVVMGVFLIEATTEESA